ncbi:Transcription elongation factor A protein 1 Transcription elongation factor S-II protein 1 [Channa argus]|uniref:Transcription elongation factor A protein 1 Transcription elongation factor S-II protein 1 n=1 Tax=Channa argus TaxID=215402 RepID=A0A6G1Q961_CHAAH|nr:Transcription elongation factor A protein 1 Transcription elongation factor S-II protein 1 [Channa argus]
MGKKEEEEIIRIAKKMDKMAQKKNGAGALDLLKELRSVPMTLELLQSTRIGMSVNAIRKQSTDEEVTSLAKSLIKSWKKLLDEPGGGDTTTQTTPVSPSQGSPEAKEERIEFLDLLPRIFQEFKNTDMKYKNRVRSRISNLKDMKNPNLRRTVLCGSVTPERMAKMTAEEMASDELKEMRKNLTKEAVRDHQMATTGGTQTDLFTCGKCKGKCCTYTQVQTRSADEPMTTFVFCNQCGNRWKAFVHVLIMIKTNIPRSTSQATSGDSRNITAPSNVECPRIVIQLLQAKK